MSRRCTLALGGLTLRVTIGSLPSERLSPRPVILDLVWRGETEPEAPAVDYAEVAARLESLSERRFTWIEELAAAALELLEENWQGSWKVTVTKGYPPAKLPLDSASCTLEGGIP